MLFRGGPGGWVGGWVGGWGGGVVGAGRETETTASVASVGNGEREGGKGILNRNIYLIFPC